jgi:RecB family exonuclease
MAPPPRSAARAPTAPRIRLVSAASAERRIEQARAWLRERAPAEEVLVVASTLDAANELLRSVGQERGAAFGWHRAAFSRLAAELAAEGLAREDRVPVGSLVTQAVMARVVHDVHADGSLGRFERAVGGPGLVRALGAAVVELRLAALDPREVEKESMELARVMRAYDAALAEAGLADRAHVFALACERARDSAAHAWLDRPTLLLDVAVSWRREQELVAALRSRAPDLLALLPAGDAASRAALCSALGLADAEILLPADAANELSRLQQHLFEGSAPPEGACDDGNGALSIVSAPGESRECVEIARRIQVLAGAGTPFDRIAVLLRSPDEYRPHLVEALRRAGIPAHFARGAVTPDPAGRAFVALLGCAAEDLSARRFAEYLSLGEVPDAGAGGAPPEPAARSERWVAPDEEMVTARVAEALSSVAALEPSEGEDVEAGQPVPAEDLDAPVAGGRLRAPRRWEELLVDAAVIGGRERWERRLDGLAHERELDLEALDDVDDPRAERFRRDLADLSVLREFALPLLDELASLPESAQWGEWLDRLSALATRALRRPARVLSVLAELSPMESVGPVGLAEVQLVLSRRLLELASPPSAARYGKVFVAPVDAARGLAFDAVFVPGLAEKLFPKKLDEEPILLDAPRRRIGGLPTSEERVAGERLLLRIAAGAAGRSLVLSYPRLDLDQGRPRVPSFYALEARRAATGRLPGFDELARGAEAVTSSRVGWPAPPQPDHAIDAAEYDLALLDQLLAEDPEKSQGAARFLLTANAHLARALRFRARRWINGWNQADGFVNASPEGMRALERHGLSARSFSPTALQNYAACPYRFFLYAVHRLSPREVPESIEEMPPLQRGSMVHEVQFELFGSLREAGLLPVTAGNVERVREELDRVLDRVAERYRDELAPAIDRVWKDGVEAVRADLREWLRRATEDDSGFVPWRFELSFGLPGDRDRDPHSSDEPVQLDAGLQLRGSIDLVERRADGRIRVTDHKTGKVRVKTGDVVAGGEALQPVLYALAAEKLFPEATVESGRLYYCTSAGGFAERTVALDREARDSAAKVAEVIGQALGEGFLPAAPDRDACRWCDYLAVCGPYEELRTRRKQRAPLEPLLSLRKLR